ncbi:hypothetical protein ACA910_015799 [Epithemia clementina (nom. ined.)]
MSSSRSSSLADKISRSRRLKLMTSMSPTPSVEQSNTNSSDKLDTTPTPSMEQPATRAPSPTLASKAEKRKALAKAHMKQTMGGIQAASSTASSSDDEKQHKQAAQQQSTSTATTLAEKRRRAMSRVTTRMATPSKPIVESYSNESSGMSSGASSPQDKDQKDTKQPPTFHSKYNPLSNQKLAPKEETTSNSKQEESDSSNASSAPRNKLFNKYASIGMARRSNTSPVPPANDDKNNVKLEPKQEPQAPAEPATSTTNARSVTSQNSTAVKAALAATRPRLRLGAETSPGRELRPPSAAETAEAAPTSSQSTDRKAPPASTNNAAAAGAAQVNNAAAGAAQVQSYETQKRLLRSRSPSPSPLRIKPLPVATQQEQPRQEQKSTPPVVPQKEEKSAPPKEHQNHLPKKPMPRKLHKFLQDRNQKDENYANNDNATAPADVDAGRTAETVGMSDATVSSVHSAPMERQDATGHSDILLQCRAEIHDDIHNEEEPEVSALTAGQGNGQKHEDEPPSGRLSVYEMKNRFQGSSSPAPQLMASASHHVAHPHRIASPALSHLQHPRPAFRMSSPMPPAQRNPPPMISSLPVPTPAYRSASPVAMISPVPPPKHALAKPVPQSAHLSPVQLQPHSNSSLEQGYSNAIPPHAPPSLTTARPHDHINPAMSIDSPAMRKQQQEQQQQSHIYHLNQAQSMHDRPTLSLGSKQQQHQQFAQRAASPTPSHGSSSVMGRQTPSRHFMQNPVVVQPVGMPDLGPISPELEQRKILQHPEIPEILPKSYSYSAPIAEHANRFEVEAHPPANHMEPPYLKSLSHSNKQVGHGQSHIEAEDHAADHDFHHGASRHLQVASRSHYQSSQQGRTAGLSSLQHPTLEPKQEEQQAAEIRVHSSLDNRSQNTRDQQQPRNISTNQSDIEPAEGQPLGTQPLSTDGRVTIETPESVSVSKFKRQFDKPENVAIHPDKSVGPHSAGKWNQPRRQSLGRQGVQPEPNVQQVKKEDPPQQQTNAAANHGNKRQPRKENQVEQRDVTSEPRQNAKTVDRLNSREHDPNPQHSGNPGSSQPTPSIMNYWRTRIDGPGSGKGNADDSDLVRGDPSVPSPKSPPSGKNWNSRQMNSGHNARNSPRNANHAESPGTELPIEGNSRAVIEVPEKQSVANMADRFKNGPQKSGSPQVRGSSPAPYGGQQLRPQGEQRSPTNRKSIGSIESSSAQNRLRSMSQASPSISRSPSPFGTPQDQAKWRSPSPARSDVSHDISKRKTGRLPDSSKTGQATHPLSPGRARVMQEQARWRSQSPHRLEASENNNKAKAPTSRPSWVRPIDTSPGIEPNFSAPNSPTKSSPRVPASANFSQQSQSTTPRMGSSHLPRADVSSSSPEVLNRRRESTSSDVSYAGNGRHSTGGFQSYSHDRLPGSPNRHSPRNRAQQAIPGRRLLEPDERSDTSSTTPSMRRPLSPSSYQNRGIDQSQFSIDRKHHEFERDNRGGISGFREGSAAENSQPKPRSPSRAGLIANAQLPDLTDPSRNNVASQPGHSKSSYLSAPPTLPAEARSKDAFQELQQKLLKRQHDIEATSMASTQNVDNLSARAAAKVAGSIMDDSFAEEKKSALEDDIPPQQHHRHTESPSTLGELAAQSIHAMDYDQSSYDLAGHSKSSSPSIDEEESSKYASAIPNNLAVPPEFAQAVSPPRYQNDDQVLEETPIHKNTENGVVFGNPDTYGAAGGGLDRARAPPTVADRAKAIADWKGGIGTKIRELMSSEEPVDDTQNSTDSAIYPLREDAAEQSPAGVEENPTAADQNDVDHVPTRGADSFNPERPTRGASAVLRFWNQTTPEDLETAEQFKDADPLVSDYVSDVQMSDVQDQLRFDAKKLISPNAVKELRHFRNRSDGQSEGTEQPPKPETKSVQTAAEPDPFSPSAISGLKTHSKASKGTFDPFWGHNDDFEVKCGFAGENAFSNDDGFPQTSGFAEDKNFGFGDSDGFGGPSDGFGVADDTGNVSGFGSDPAFGMTHEFHENPATSGLNVDGFGVTDAFSSSQTASHSRSTFARSGGSDNDGFPVDYGFGDQSSAFGSNRDSNDPFSRTSTADHRRSSNDDGFGSDFNADVFVTKSSGPISVDAFTPDFGLDQDGDEFGQTGNNYNTSNTVDAFGSAFDVSQERQTFSKFSSNKQDSENRR